MASDHTEQHSMPPWNEPQQEPTVNDGQTDSSAQQGPEGDGITYPYPDDRERTHWEGCWQDPGHHNCAVAEIHRLLREREDPDPNQPEPDPEPVEGDPWEDAGSLGRGMHTLRVAAEMFPNEDRDGVEVFPSEAVDILGYIARLRARVQPRRVGGEEFEVVVALLQELTEKCWSRTINAGQPTAELWAVKVLYALGIEITPEEGESDG